MRPLVHVSNNDNNNNNNNNRDTRKKKVYNTRAACISNPSPQVKWSRKLSTDDGEQQNERHNKYKFALWFITSWRF